MTEYAMFCEIVAKQAVEAIETGLVAHDNKKDKVIMFTCPFLYLID